MQQSMTSAAPGLGDGPANCYESLRQRHLLGMRARVPVLLERLDWPAEKLKAWREARLRELVRDAQVHSVWFGRRFAGIDAVALTEDSLKDLPPMTKDDVMAHFDEIVTDSRLTLDVCETHLAQLKSDAYLLDRYHVSASGGSSGRRGLGVYDWEGWADGWAGFLRCLVRLRARDPDAAPARNPIVAAAIAALDPTHMSSAVPQTFSDPTTMVMHRFPVTLPFEQIAAGVDALKPDLLIGYASMLHRLACAAQEGALAVTPKIIVSASEPLLAETRRAINTAWSARMLNFWASTEAMTLAVSCGFGPGMHLNDDQLIIEPVDADGHAVPCGVRAAKIYVTNLSNVRPLPLIRYEITDEVTLLDTQCPCGSAHRLIDDLQGRLDDGFYYPRIGMIHPHIFRSRLSQERYIVEYQVRQTPRGAAIATCCNGEVDFARIQDSLVYDLDRIGLAAAEISIARVDKIARQKSGKLKRFVPLEPTPLASEGD